MLLSFNKRRAKQVYVLWIENNTINKWLFQVTLPKHTKLDETGAKNFPKQVTKNFLQKMFLACLKYSFRHRCFFRNSFAT